MLLQFSFGNYRSFKDKATLSMVASKDKEHKNSHVFQLSDKINVLRSAAIYGANASGKSNLIQAIMFMRNFVLTSSKETISSQEKINVDPFLLDIESEKSPSTFEVVFTIEKDRFRYGFQVDSKKVVNEWLFYSLDGKTRESQLFIRENTNDFDVKPSFKGASKIQKELTVKDNILFLSLCSQLGVEIADKIISQFFLKIGIIKGTESVGYECFTVEQMDKKEYLDFYIELLKTADTGISGLKKTEKAVDENDLPDNIPDLLRKKLVEGKVVDVMSRHAKLNESGEDVGDVFFNMEQQESEGTHQLFCLAGPLFDSIKSDRILIVDEFSTKLHPRLVRAIVDLFHNTGKGDEFSNSSAQMIFATHNTDIMTKYFFRRDQIYLVDKNKKESSVLYALSDFQKGKPRKDASYSKDYIAGKYGAVPSIGSLNDLEELINGTE